MNASTSKNRTHIVLTVRHGGVQVVLNSNRRGETAWSANGLLPAGMLHDLGTRFAHRVGRAEDPFAAVHATACLADAADSWESLRDALENRDAKPHHAVGAGDVPNMDREACISWLKWNDSNGDYDDEAARAQGLEPMTLEQARASVLRQLAEGDDAVTGEPSEGTFDDLLDADDEPVPSRKPPARSEGLETISPGQLKATLNEFLKDRLTGRGNELHAGAVQDPSVMPIGRFLNVVPNHLASAACAFAKRDEDAAVAALFSVATLAIKAAARIRAHGFGPIAPKN